MFKRILIPLDGSPFAENVLSWLPRFAKAGECELFLITAVEPHRYVHSLYEYTPIQILEEVREQNISYLETIRSQLQRQHYQVSTQVAQGDATDEIIKASVQHQADLIAMTSHGRSGVARFALGSVAERVIHAANLPVLLVREPTTITSTPLRTIMTPLDGSELAEQTLPVVITLAQETGASVLLSHVVAPADLPTGVRQQAAEKKSFAWADTYLKGCAEKVRSQQVPCETYTAFGDVTEALQTLADKQGIDLIVMSTHGRSGLSCWVYGSVTNRVMRAAPCPVLVLRSKPNEEGIPISFAHVKENTAVA